MSVTFCDDTLREMAVWAVKKYNLGDISIVWQSHIPREGGAYSVSGGVVFGATIANLDGTGPICIALLESRTHSLLTQVLAHELSHCVAIRRHQYLGHGKIIKKVSAELIRSWNSRVERGTR